MQGQEKTQPKANLKSLYTRGKFGPEFIEAAQRELPSLWGRLSLLEEFYSANCPGLGDRSRVVSDQLGKPIPLKLSLLARFKMVFSR